MFWNTVQNVIKSIESFGKFKVHSGVNEMGPLNQSMWKSANIHSKRDSTSVSAIHPNDQSRNLFFIADPAHLIKNLRNLLLTHDVILPEQYIRQKNLQSNTLTLKCVEFLVKHQENMHLKIQPKLSSINVNRTLYQKMRVNLASNIFSFETQAALVYLKDKSPNPKVM